MAIINSYASGTVTTSDLILGVDTSTSKNTTKTFSAGDIASLASGSTAYDSYVALLTQTGTAAPVATVLSNNLTATLTWARTGTGIYTLSNNLTATLTWARTGTGIYTLTANAATFTANKTIVFLNPGNDTTAVLIPPIVWTRTSDTVLTFTTGVDAAITNGSLEVRIY